MTHDNQPIPQRNNSRILEGHDKIYFHCFFFGIHDLVKGEEKIEMTDRSKFTIRAIARVEALKSNRWHYEIRNTCPGAFKFFQIAKAIQNDR